MSWPQVIQQVWLLWFFTLFTRKLPTLTPALFILSTKLYFTLQWWIQGRGLHPLFLDQTEAQRAEKIFFGELRTPYPPPPIISRSGAGTVLPTLIMSSVIYYLYLQVMFHEKDFLFRVSVILLFVKNVSNLFQVTEALSLVIKLAEYLAKLPKVSVNLTIRQTVHNKLHGIE